MPVTQFPDPRSAPPDGLLAVGGDLHPDTLFQAYSQGIFPWPMDFGRQKGALAWFSPDPRAILEFKDLHIPESLARARRQARLEITSDQAFEDVIRACARVPRPGQAGTWITSPMLDAYVELHRRGLAHSIEVWDGSHELVGGIYGVEVRGVFAGESMFYLKPNVSKIALLNLIERLAAKGAQWMDIQMLTPHMQKLGAKEINRDQYLQMLSLEQARGLKLFP